ncbi:MAG TPA: isochorismate synthase, partial [Myxococcota bacterium]|nr:isochorismate synthase [Myxococcota bacterium]
VRYVMGTNKPERADYYASIAKALKHMANNQLDKKVVLGRRRSIFIKPMVDPIELYFRLSRKAKDAFLFFFDDGKSAFFGGSPELLYRRKQCLIETESLAGTRPRSTVDSDDRMLRESLLTSFKDNREHALVSTHIEEKLREFGATYLFSSPLEIMALPYVQHLLKRYRGTIDASINDATIIAALHPTPAVCGLGKAWALDFIRHNEGFDRGFYAGPIGYIAKDEAEFAVAIRSALFRQDELFIYAAGGIVQGSIFEQEWAELNNKEENILSIFDDS